MPEPANWSARKPDTGVTNMPCWVPSNTSGVQLVSCGRWWDALRLPCEDWGHLPDVCPGAGVIQDRADRVLVWLVPVGSVDAWRPPGAQVLDRGHLLPVPPVEWSTSWWLTWRQPPIGDAITDPDQLRRAMSARPSADVSDVCVQCGCLPTAPAVISGRDADGQPLDLTACQAHVAEGTTALEYPGELASGTRRRGRSW
ncbi:hypothetical protein [Streptomyces carpaticus]|uniref:hypothetical protein n=1 Tax=Streptomyces carpaticus TaxID=285558 RepID=UPI0031FA3F56